MRPLSPVHGRVVAALRTLLAGAPALPPAMTVESLGDEPWHSATLSGTRHQLTLRAAGTMAAVEALADAVELALEPAELDLGPELYAGASVTEADVRWRDDGLADATLTLSVLTIGG